MLSDQDQDAIFFSFSRKPNATININLRNFAKKNTKSIPSTPATIVEPNLFFLRSTNFLILPNSKHKKVKIEFTQVNRILEKKDFGKKQ